MERFYHLEERVPWGVALPCAAQHVLAMFVGIVTPPLIIASALQCDAAQTRTLINMALFVSGLTTFVQVRRFGPVGSGLLSVQGTSFTFVPLALEAGKAGGLPLIFGMTLAAAPVELVLSRCLGIARKLFPPVVTGSVVMLIGMSLIRVGIVDLSGGVGAVQPGHLRSLLLGGLVMAVIIALNRFAGGRWRTLSIAGGILAGYLFACWRGYVQTDAIAAAPWVSAPAVLAHAPTVRLELLLPWMVGYLVTTMETIGDLTATSAVSGEPVAGPLYQRRLKGGVLADALGSALAGLMNTTPNTTFSQNNGVIRLTGVASRRVGLAVAGLLVLLGLFPKLGAAIGTMPKPVLGGATLIMFGTVAVAGLRIVVRDGLTGRNEFILAVTLALGLGVTMVPDSIRCLDLVSDDWAVFRPMLGILKGVLSSGLATGALTACILNLALPHRVEPLRD